MKLNIGKTFNLIGDQMAKAVDRYSNHPDDGIGIANIAHFFIHKDWDIKYRLNNLNDFWIPYMRKYYNIDNFVSLK